MTEPPRQFADETKLRIIAAAESLYSQNSIESVSFREIALAAGNKNTNAVQYHFGNRETLVQAIFAWRVWQMEPVRGVALDAAEKAGKPLSLPTLMRILCEPILDLTDDQGRHTYAAFMSKYLLLQRPAGTLHAADTRPDLSTNLRRILDQVNELVAAEDLYLGDYRVALSYLVVINTLVLSDNEGLPKHDPARFRKRFDISLDMAVAALERSCNT
ncbi:TetR/AcrR family transcriptional regulator [Novosphingobium sp. 18050]|uniref:TetR/AcrR family transcriptional regulator n=1 Tax=Novosphingobium sp. 18050 TaxID=2681398 RepID=UPI0013588765|nr:TetR/AcrR family transcriptional regulator [Novosphingobium sp. 18050]